MYPKKSSSLTVNIEPMSQEGTLSCRPKTSNSQANYGINLPQLKLSYQILLISKLSHICMRTQPISEIKISRFICFICQQRKLILAFYQKTPLLLPSRKLQLFFHPSNRTYINQIKKQILISHSDTEIFPMKMVICMCMFISQSEQINKVIASLCTIRRLSMI